MMAKIQITGTARVVTGMHIGGNGAAAAIGAVDSPVIKDVVSGRPIIPGSSLKGKMRSLLARQYNTSVVEHDSDHPRICRLFGTANNEEKICNSRIIVSDMFMSNANWFDEKEISKTEIKFENSINRQTAVANPRQVERVIRGAEFLLDIIYNVENETEFLEDMEMLKEGMKLLTYDYIGGSGSRGYGKIAFENLSFDVVIGTVEENLLEDVKKLFNAYV